MDITLLKPTLISPNNYNPNVVEESIMVQLEKDIKRVGIRQPVIVRKDTDNLDRFIIVDGEHRWRVASELGLEQIPCEVVEISESEAKILTITMNRFRGEFDSIKLASVLKSLKETYSPEELEDRLGYSPEELKGYEELIDFDFDALEDDEANLNSIATDVASEGILLSEFLLSLNLEQLEIIEAAISTELTSQGSRENSLTFVCKNYLSTHNPDALIAIEDRRKKLDNLAKEEENNNEEEIE